MSKMNSILEIETKPYNVDSKLLKKFRQKK